MRSTTMLTSASRHSEEESNIGLHSTNLSHSPGLDMDLATMLQGDAARITGKDASKKEIRKESHILPVTTFYYLMQKLFRHTELSISRHRAE